MESSHLHLFFGGSYSNIHALEALKEEAEKLQIPAANIYHTGDVVGYCASPNETVNAVRDWGINVIAGNVEVQLREGEENCGCNFDEGSRCADFSNLWYPYAQMQVTQSNIEWMKTLKNHQVIEVNGLRIGIIHGGIDNISEFIFKSTPSVIKEEIIKQLNVDVIVAGHCGIPFMQQLDKSYWINPGVIGMPANDGTTRVWYVVYNSKTSSFSIHSLEYDFKKASEEMIQKNLPIEYVKTIVDGRWDNCEILPSEETKMQGEELVEEIMRIQRKRQNQI
ncbi:metallophosphoesterase [Brumimicrobium glaciale]|uniref:Metallophosphoesterase n=1 Tax=Brumimicrobium glaciale TaxID=200475 RepID=A0A4Q4KI55_9FLAO|nr:metallophosphoesterase family protein [Brumimicrobium glaciale]RYM32835.1 metallophosphoesterase [Brumimicrobium glaciale]